MIVERMEVEYKNSMMELGVDCSQSSSSPIWTSLLKKLRMMYDIIETMSAKTMRVPLSIPPFVGHVV